MGGHGGLNILPQKSWNVYGYDNRRKVQEAEAEAEALKQEAISRARAEQTAHAVQQMRSRMGQTDTAPEYSQHINFFEAEERAMGNHEHEREKKAQEARQIARLMPDLQLDKSTKEAAPWYTRLPQPAAPSTAHISTALPAEPSGKQQTTVLALEQKPDLDVGKHIRKHRKHKHRSSSSDRKERKKHKRAECSAQGSDDECSNVGRTSDDSLLLLRRQREEREAKERRKAQQLSSFGASRMSVSKTGAIQDFELQSSQSRHAIFLELSG